jgi:ribosome maturation factor RimP
MEHGITSGTVTLESRLREIVEGVLQDSPLYLVDLDIRGRKGSQVIDVFIDSDTTLDVEALARVSREVGFMLETEDAIKGSYNLNVSSPGVDRPLSSPRQFKKNVGRKLKVKHRTGEGSSATEEGTLASVSDEFIELNVERTGVLKIPHIDILEAKVQLPW